MGEAFFWGLVAGSSLLIGRDVTTLGFALAFGISALQ
jgi:hypothetical protein